MLHISNSEGFLLEVSFSIDQFPKHIHFRGTQQRFPPKYIDNAFLGYSEYFYEMSRMYLGLAFMLTSKVCIVFRFPFVT